MIRELLCTLKERGIRLRVENGELKFNAPKGALTPELRDEIGRHKNRIIELLLMTSDTEEESIPIAPKATEYPLSFAQQRLWFLSQLDSDQSAYNLPAALRISGPLDHDALEKGFAEILDRHDILRTAVVTRDGEAFQKVTAGMDAPIQRHSWSDGIDDSEALQEFLAEKAWLPFDLSQAPLMRIHLVTLSQTEHILMVVMHHIITDGWSMNLLLKEFVDIYSTLSAGNATQRPASSPLPLQYTDFAVWQRAQATSPRIEGQRDYWSKQLRDAPPPLSLPFDRPRPAVQTHNGETLEFRLDQDITDAIRAVAQETGSTLFIVMLAAYAAFLSRYSQSDDIIIGSPIASRTRTELENLVGFFANTLALRVDLSGSPSFVDLVSQTKEVVLDADSHQDVPLEQIIDDLQPGRALSHSPLFQVMLVMQNTASPEYCIPGLTIEGQPIKSRSAKFDLTLFISESKNERIHGRWEYNTDLFDSATAKRMIGHFKNLLVSIAHNPSQPVSDCAIMDSEEKDRIVTQWNNTKVDFPAKAAHEMFEMQADSNPTGIAVTDASTSLSYGELEERSNLLCNHLKELGIGRECIVAVSMDRTIDLMTAILAILKAGAAYLPIDPSYPEERITFMLTDSSASAIVCSGSPPDGVPSDLRCLDMASIDPALAAASPVRPRFESDPIDDLAYVIYTSGSTGKPKGVMITHLGFSNYLHWASDYYSTEHGSGAPVASSIGFDATITSMFLPLVTGRTVHLVPSDNDLATLCNMLQEGRDFSFLKVTPAHLDVLRELLTATTLPEPPRDLILGGEQLYRRSLRTWQAQAPKCRIINEYGPTEAVVGCCVHDATKADLDDGDVVPIGRPIANTQIYILDSSMRPVPIGVQGEIYIGGHGVALGYLNRPDLTKERFVASPFGSHGHCDRLYKTGDLAKYRDDGTLIYCGRTDFQVKIRGFRIELDEIAAALCEHNHIRDAIVVTSQSTAETVSLVAYYLATPEDKLSRDEALRFLRRSLPEHMIPSVFIRLDRFPFTSNGKIDREALPAPSSDSLTTPFTAPHTENEKILVEIWKEVLNREQVGTRDNFFELGGDSILSIQIVSRASQKGLTLEPRQVFQYQTIEELAAVATSSTMTETVQGPVEGSCHLLPIQHDFFELNTAQPNHYNQAVSLELAPEIQYEHIEAAISELVHHHDALRLTFSRSADSWSGFFGKEESAYSVSSMDLSDRSMTEQNSMIAAEAERINQQLDIENGPMLRAVHFLRVAPQSSILLLAIHHLVVDGVSWRLLLEDFATILNQILSEAPIRLPRKTSSFQDWAEALNDYANTPQVLKQESYWSNVTTNPPVLPVDFPQARQENTWGTSSEISKVLPSDITNTLVTTAAPAYGVEFQHLLLVALCRSFVHWTGSHRLLLSMEGHGRESLFEHINVSRTVGWFTTVYPLLIDLENTARLTEQLRNVKDQLSSVPDHGLGYGLIHRAHSPEVSFNYLGRITNDDMAHPILGLSHHSGGTLQGPDNHRAHLLDIMIMLTDSGLQTDWVYNSRIHSSSTVTLIADNFNRELTMLAQQAGKQTDSADQHLTFANIDEDTLDDISEMLDAADIT